MCMSGLSAEVHVYPSIAEAKECPMRGIVPRNSGANFFAADSFRMSMIAFVLPV